MTGRDEDRTDFHIRETVLPGIGRRYDVELGGRSNLVIVVDRHGGCEVGLAAPGAEEVASSVHLEAGQAHTVAAILMGVELRLGP